MFFLLALILLGTQAEQRGEGLTLAGLPLGAFSGEGHLERAGKAVRLELRTAQGQRSVTLSFWANSVDLGGMWRVRGSGNLAPDGLTQRLELRRAQAHLIFLDNV